MYIYICIYIYIYAIWIHVGKAGVTLDSVRKLQINHGRAEVCPDTHFITVTRPDPTRPEPTRPEPTRPRTLTFKRVIRTQPDITFLLIWITNKDQPLHIFIIKTTTSTLCNIPTCFTPQRATFRKCDRHSATSRSTKWVNRCKIQLYEQGVVVRGSTHCSLSWILHMVIHFVELTVELYLWC